MNDAPFRQRFLDHACERRGVVTFAFVLSGLVFFASLAIVLFADVSRASHAVALVDAVVGGIVLVGSALLLRACNRFNRGR